MTASSPLQPIDPTTVADPEKEEHAPWIMRKLVGSMTGRIVMASYESLRATGTTVICLSPWGDSSPLLLPCIRFRDIAIHTVIVATGGVAAVAAPVMGPVAAEVVATFGSSIAVQAGLVVGYDLGTKVANDLLINKPIGKLIPTHSMRLNTTAVKKLLITLNFKHTVSDAALGFFRSPVHKNTDLFANVKDYLSIEKGWLSPYLFASSRRPIIPRSMKPDVIFCHGPFLNGDYDIGETLLAESASVVKLCIDPPPRPPAAPEPSTLSKIFPGQHDTATPPTGGRMQEFLSGIKKTISRTPSPEPGSTADHSSEPKAPDTPPPPPPPRRMLITVLGIAPHRTFWTTSARPGESVLHYILLNGCPAIVIPVKPGSPLLAWDTLTLAHLHKVEGGVDGKTFEEIVQILFEYVSLCVDWERVVVPEEDDNSNKEVVEDGNTTMEAQKQDAVKAAIALVVAGAIKSGESKQVKKDVLLDRAGITMFRIP